MKIFRHSYFLILIFLLATCIQEELPEQTHPIVTTTVNEITASGVSLGGTIQFHNLNDVVDHGFVLGKEKELSLENSIYFRLGKAAGETFSAAIRSGIIEKQRYYVRSYAIANGKTVYGPMQDFMSLGSEGPILEEISPAEGSAGDTINLRGKNFSFRKELNVVVFDKLSAKVVSSTDTLLSVIAPSLTRIDNAVRVSILDNASEEKIFKLKTPKITGFSLETFTLCDTIAMTGEALSSFGSQPFIAMNGLGAKVISVSSKQIKFTMTSLVNNPIEVKVYGGLFQQVAPQKLSQIRPEITAISQDLYEAGDTIDVSVRNWPACIQRSVSLSHQNGLKYPVEVIENNMDRIRFIAPSGCIPTTKFVISGNTFSVSSVDIKPRPPKITSITPNNGKIGDLIAIKGEGFPDDINAITVDFLDLTYASSTELRGRVVEIPSTIPTVDVSVIYCQSATTIENGFTYHTPEITSFSPAIITSQYDVLIINGKNFSPIGNVVYINGEPVSTSGADLDGTQITVSMDLLLNDNLSKQLTGKLTVITNMGLSVTSDQDIVIDYVAPWKVEASFPGNSRSRPASVTIGNFAYVGMGSSSSTWYKDWWQFDGTTWKRMADFPESGDFGITRAATAAGKIFYGLLHRNKNWWQFDPVSNQWTRKADFPGVTRSLNFTFTINDKVYVGGGSASSTALALLDFWEYDPATNIWTQKASLPGYALSQSIAFEHQSLGYTFGKSGTMLISYSYDPGPNVWTTRETFGSIPSFAGGWDAVKFNEFLLLHSNQFSTPVFYLYHPYSGGFTQAESTLGANRSFPALFNLNNRGYIGLGHNFGFLRDLFSFDQYRIGGGP